MKQAEQRRLGYLHVNHLAVRRVEQYRLTRAPASRRREQLLQEAEQRLLSHPRAVPTAVLDYPGLHLAAEQAVQHW